MNVKVIKTQQDDLNIDVRGIETFTQLNEFLRIKFPFGYKTTHCGDMTLFSDGKKGNDKVILIQD